MKLRIAALASLAILISACGVVDSLNHTDVSHDTNSNISSDIPLFNSSKTSVSSGDTVTFSWNFNSANTQIFLNTESRITDAAILIASKNNLNHTSSDSVTCTRTGTILDCSPASLGPAEIGGLIMSTPSLYVIAQAAEFSADITSTNFTYYSVRVNFP